MKYAIFEFCDTSNEIGETRWIIREDPTTFQNSTWDTSKEVMVAWPDEFTKVSKKIVKGSIDPTLVPTKTCVAKVIRFCDDYEKIREIRARYVDTGLVDTPKHGRGLRTSKKNGRYAVEDVEESELKEKPSKRQKQATVQSKDTPSDAAINALKAKYNLLQEKIPQISTGNPFDSESENEADNSMSDDEEECQMTDIKKENAALRNKIAHKNREIKRLNDTIKNLKEISSLPGIVMDLRKQVEMLKNQRHSSPQGCPSSPDQPSTSSETTSINSADNSENETDLVSLCPNITLTKSQYKNIRSKTQLKDFVYAIMGMLWSRDVLCTHSLTGKVSNAYKEKDAKPQLDAEKVQSICDYGSKRFGCTTDSVKKLMTTRINNIVKVEKAKGRASKKED